MIIIGKGLIEIVTFLLRHSQCNEWRCADVIYNI